ncbi:hypothetical protein Nepgr_018462 [Nepenthes gracilis]|uniref:IBH1-like N-terminal domain-containing protein n=1 Tax=Nepenthes gracilis TaxID=150966 RepID=A0AAD3XUC2_NEPGR|nr:hypothetical protein Nepgr_018462 [Nepenthes gracilis]
MRPPISLEKEFLKKWVMGLQKWSSTSKEMSFLERKKAIKLSADVAMASARNGSTLWSRALIAGASKDPDTNAIVKHVVTGSTAFASLPPPIRLGRRRVCSNKALRKARINHFRRPSRKSAASSIVKRLVKKRTQVIKGLVPGGERIDDESCLIKETLDYVISLRAQVHVMQQIANAAELLNTNNN